jgi:transposase
MDRGVDCVTISPWPIVQRLMLSCKKRAPETERKVKRDARFDGKWVLRTDTDLPAAEVALRYKDLLMVEEAFGTPKSLLETQPIYHHCDDTIRGHVFCSSLALVLWKELDDRMLARG